jgi:hypothetical protein
MGFGATGLATAHTHQLEWWMDGLGREAAWEGGAINRGRPPLRMLWTGDTWKKATYLMSQLPAATSSFPSAMSSSAPTPMNKYWIPHLDIHKKVITQELQYYLGPEATVRSFTREVSNGSAPGSRWPGS